MWCSAWDTGELGAIDLEPLNCIGAVHHVGVVGRLTSRCGVKGCGGRGVHRGVAADAAHAVGELCGDVAVELGRLEDVVLAGLA